MSDVDTWGNLRGDPVKTIQETHDNDFIEVIIYKGDKLFYYGYSLRLGTLILRKAANIKNESYLTAEAARSHACKEIQEVCTRSRNAQKAIVNFTRIWVQQGELF
ncbi:hypothetical protein FACS1894172_16120 [Spirochaetia bacterium]|nr:hypothetical protein FACS1894172_16120 [Spirochaetia bacterium]